MKMDKCELFTVARGWAAILVLILTTGGLANANVPNDDCASAQVVTDGTPAAEGDNSQASATDDDEASCYPYANKDVWFEYVATCNGSVTVDTFGSDQPDTVLSVYDACGGAEIVCNDDTNGTLSEVVFDATAAQSYWIRLASFVVPGDYDLNVTCIGTPVNDDCASALLVTEGAPAAGGNNALASEIDDAEASCRQFADHDVWFEYVAGCTGSVAVDTFDSGQEDTVLSVYDACGGTEIACNDDTGGTRSQVIFDATATQSYWIRLASVAAPGDYVLNISCSGFPGNDDCASALVVTDGTPAAEGDNSQASVTDDDEASCYPFADEDVWFEYVPACTGGITVNTFGSDQADTVLSVYGACGGEEIACNDDAGGTLSQVSFIGTVGQSYWIRLASFALPGDYDLNVIGTEDSDGDDICDDLDICAGSDDHADCNANSLVDCLETSGTSGFAWVLSDNTTGFDDAVFAGAPDDNSVGIGGQAVEYDFSTLPIQDGDGPDFNVYEVDSGTAEFDIIDVLASDDGMTFVSLRGLEQALVRIPGDEAHGDDALGRSYDLADVGLSEAQFIRIEGDGSDPAGGTTGFDLDAVGGVNLAPAADCNTNEVPDECEIFGDVARSFARDTPTPQPDLDDVLCILDDFAEGKSWDGCPNSEYSTDLAPCGGDGVIDLADIFAVLDAFAGNFTCPLPCP